MYCNHTLNNLLLFVLLLSVLHSLDCMYHMGESTLLQSEESSLPSIKFYTTTSATKNPDLTCKVIKSDLKIMAWPVCLLIMVSMPQLTLLAAKACYCVNACMI